MADKLFHADEQQRAFADFLMAEDSNVASELHDFMPPEIYSLVNMVSQGKSYTKTDKTKLNEFLERKRTRIARVWKNSPQYSDTNSS